MNLPKVSVLVPCYNHANYVLKCLESIQTSYVGEIEVIICDDNSKDNSVKKIEDFISATSRENITYTLIKHEENKGVSETLNDCFAQSTADFIYTIASDDYFLKNGITQAMNILLETSADAVISDCVVVDENNILVHASAFFEYRHASLTKLQKNISRELVFNWVVPGPALLQKKTTLISLNGYSKNLMAEDRDYYLRLLATKKVVFNKGTVACYRVHTHNASKSQIYLSKAKQEFSIVNYNSHVLYDGLAKYYLKSYWLDLNNIPGFLASHIRKLIKAMYIIRG